MSTGLSGVFAAPAHADNSPCGITALSAGGSHSLAIGAGGVVYAWGRNDSGQLGDGSTAGRSRPVQVLGLSGISAVSAGGDHSLAIGAGGIVYAWGANNLGQLGDGTTNNRSGPVQVPGLSGISAVSAGGGHSLAIGAGGVVHAWGFNFYGQLGDGTNTNRFSPVQMRELSGITGVSAGGEHSLMIGAGGTVYASGNNDYGQLGDGTTTRRASPVQVPGLSGITAVAAGALYSLALGASSTVYSWGANYVGQLGDGTTNNRSNPAQVPGLSAITGIAAGSGHSLTITASGATYAWGANWSGQLGDGTTTNRSNPAQVPGLSGITAIEAGSEHSLVIGTGGAVHAWGANSSGQLGDGAPGPYRASAVQINCNPPPSVTGVSDSPDPVFSGNSITFSVNWTDPTLDDQVRAVICKTNAINGAVCPGGVWASGSLSGASPATASYITTGTDIGTRTYYAFACDATNACSGSVSGTFTVNAAGPSATTASDTPDPVATGGSITFSVGWTDPNAGEQVRAVICKTNAASAGTCLSGTWAVGSLSSSTPATASYSTTSADIGTRTYYAFACDTTNTCSGAIQGTFTVSPPACSDGMDNDGDGKIDYPNDPGCAGPQDQIEGPSCPPVASGVIACLTPGTMLAQYQVSTITTSPSGPRHHVAGYVDQYRFLIAGVTTTLTCVQLATDSVNANPCAVAGGIFVTRIATLLEQTLSEPTVQTTPLATITICNAELTFTIAGNGIDSAPAHALC